MCGEYGRTPAGCTWNGIFCTSKIRHTSYRKWCKQGQSRTESEGRGDREEILTQGAGLYPGQKVLLVNKTWLYDKLSLDDHAEDKQLHAFLVLDNTHSFPKICCQFSLIVSAGSKKIYFFFTWWIDYWTEHCTCFSSTKKYLHKIVLVLCTCQWTL